MESENFEYSAGEGVTSSSSSTKTPMTNNNKGVLKSANDSLKDGDQEKNRGNENEYYIDMNCGKSTEKQESADDSIYAPVESDIIYAIVSNDKRLEEVKCTSDEMKDIASTKESEVSSNSAEVGAAKKKNTSAWKVFLVDRMKKLKENWKSKKSLFSIAIGVLLLAVFICFACAFAEIGKLKMSGCSSLNQPEKIDPELQKLIANLDLHNVSLHELLAGLGSPGQFSTRPVTACSALPSASPSGYYWVRNNVGSSVRVYCDTSFSCNGTTGGWIRVAHLDMTNQSHQCPSGLRQRTDRTCVRSTTSPGCSSIAYSSANIQYSRVCGKVIAYQVGTTGAFNGHTSISSSYVDGVSLTHGSTRNHIWTFAAALSESDAASSCNCINSASNTLPSFVGMDYFCDTGVSGSAQAGTLYSDPLWDGAGCEPPNTCCDFNTPPWFYKQLPQPTTDNIEMRVCRDGQASAEDVAIETIEIYMI